MPVRSPTSAVRVGAGVQKRRLGAHTTREGGAVPDGPDGNIITGPLTESEGILYAEIDAGIAHRSRREFDPVGHYARPDVFNLTVDTRRKQPVTFQTADGE